DAPTATVAVLTAAVVLQVVSDPVLGRRDHRRLTAVVDAEGALSTRAEDARARLYRRWMALGWAWTALGLLLVAVLPAVGLRDLGLRAPDLGRLVHGFGDGDIGASVVAGLVIGALGGVVRQAVAGWRAARTALSDDPRWEPWASPAIEPMLPRTARGRRGWAGLSFTAGITEEVLYRGLLVMTLALLLPDAPPWAVVAVGAVVFGLAHVYQGPAGVLMTTVVGGGLMALYLLTGSLLLPMVLHVLLDLRALLPAPGGKKVEPSAEPSAAVGGPEGKRSR